MNTFRYMVNAFHIICNGYAIVTALSEDKVAEN